MARTKGSKNKPKSPAEEQGNPDFNVSAVTPSQTIASAAILPEDLEFDRELARMSTLELPPDIDPDPVGSIVKIERPQATMLKDAIEGTLPASTDQELREQIHTAKMHECDSIEATLSLAKRFCKDPTLEQVGYFIYHDIKVYIEGAFEKASKRDRMTVEQKMFGGSSVA